MRVLVTLFLSLVFCAVLAGTEASTTVNVSYAQSGSWLNHVTQLSGTTNTEQILVFTSDPRAWVYVQVMSPSNWTLRGTLGSTTDAIPVLANQVVTLLITGTGQTFGIYPSASQTLYVMPLTYTTPKP
jgi:hypothetical protein